ncbi:hypothetical protein SAMN06298214_0292 [Bacteroidales bacterium WCE2004]|nr:hypothetical protein SAMN06298214_0292 [Bacteroidales bacterium WCE2004]
MESSNTPLPASQTVEARIQTILDEQRAQAHDALDDLMYESFLEIGALLSAPDTPARAVAGLSPRTLQLIRQHHDAGDLAEWLAAGAGGTKSICISQFLNLNALQMQELRARFPRAFTKWAAEEDQTLLAQYQDATAQGQKVNWGALAGRFGRNVNAIKLRLEHLGVNLGPDAGHSRRS